MTSTAIVTETPTFWMVWTKTGHKPRVRHDTEEIALAEAERLARLNPGKKFIVLQATHKLLAVVAEPTLVAA